MGLLEKVKNLFRKPALPEAPKAAEEKPAARPRKACKKCGKMFSYDPSWEFIPNYCKDCKKQFTQEKEEKQRAGAPRKIKRKCRECGKFFTFPNTIAHYPNYCPNCRKAHQAAMKAKYSRKPADKNGNGKGSKTDGNR